MNTFFKSYFAALMAGATFFALCFIFMLFLIGGSKDTSLGNDRVLQIKLSGTMVDYIPPSAFPVLDELLGNGSRLSMENIAHQIRKAQDDDRIDEIYLRFDFFSAGTAQLREIRSALKEFRESGKKVTAYGQIYTRGAYYLASAADSLLIDPTGSIEWNGLASSSPYLKGALDKLGIQIQLIRGRDNDFKSAGEPLIADAMSAENRMQIESYLNSIWDELIVDLETDGRLTAEELDEIADSGYFIAADRALELGMIDGIAFEDEVLSRYMTSSEHTDYDETRLVSLSRYTREPATVSASGSDRIAVLYAEGDVTLGKSSIGSIGSESLVAALREIRTNDRIKSVVLRINSPGGVSLAADQMWREVALLAESKPVVVSMGNVAASAGYLIAMPADQVLVQPQTITGSIGVFGIYPVVQELLNDHLGIRIESVATHKYSTLGIPDRPLNERELSLIQENVDRIYDRFRDQVAEGREMDRSRVDSLARGRVWTGKQAVELGLADDFGGLLDAIEAAKNLAGLEGPVRVSSYPRMEDPFGQYLRHMQSRKAETELRERMGPLYPAYKEWTELHKRTGVQKRMLQYDVNNPF